MHGVLIFGQKTKLVEKCREQFSGYNSKICSFKLVKYDPDLVKKYPHMKEYKNNLPIFMYRKSEERRKIIQIADKKDIVRIDEIYQTCIKSSESTDEADRFIPIIIEGGKKRHNIRKCDCDQCKALSSEEDSDLVKIKIKQKANMSYDYSDVKGEESDDCILFTIPVDQLSIRNV